MESCIAVVVGEVEACHRGEAEVIEFFLLRSDDLEDLKIKVKLRMEMGERKKVQMAEKGQSSDDVDVLPGAASCELPRSRSRSRSFLLQPPKFNRRAVDWLRIRPRCSA